LELALLHAVRESDVKCVEILLRFHGIPSIQTDPPGVVRCLGVKRQRYITPLTLAACLQNFRIVELFLKNGFTICDPQTDAQQSVNSNGALNEKLGPAVFRLNRYRALASPAYIAASFLHNSLNGPVRVHRARVLKVTLYLQGCLARKRCSACSLSCRYLNSCIKLKLMELAIKLYQEF